MRLPWIAAPAAAALVAAALPLAAQQPAPITIRSITARPGTSASGFLEIPAAADAATRVPITIVHGRERGPVLALVAGTYGSEVAPIVATNTPSAAGLLFQLVMKPCTGFTTAGMSRATFAKAMAAEGFTLNQGYVTPLYWLPMYQKRHAYPKGCPFTCGHHPGDVNYSKGLCPVIEDLHVNTLLITEQCDQLCVMCSQPPKKHHVDFFDQFAIAAKLAPSGAYIGISGGEPLLHKERLFEFLVSTAAARPDLRFHILTNAQHFEADDLKRLDEIGLERVLWGIPLYACDEELHDGIVGKPGAFHRLERNLAFLTRAGASVELRTVVMQQNWNALPALAGYIATRLPIVSVWALMQLERIGYGRMNWRKTFKDTSTDFSALTSAACAWNSSSRSFIKRHNCGLALMTWEARRPLISAWASSMPR